MQQEKLACERPPIPPKPIIGEEIKPKLQKNACTEQEESLKQISRDRSSSDAIIVPEHALSDTDNAGSTMQDLEMENKELKEQLISCKSEIEQYKQDLAVARDDFTRKETDLVHTHLNQMLRLETLHNEDTKRMEEKIALLEKENEAYKHQAGTALHGFTLRKKGQRLKSQRKRRGRSMIVVRHDSLERYKDDPMALLDGENEAYKHQDGASTGFFTLRKKNKKLFTIPRGKRGQSMIISSKHDSEEEENSDPVPLLGVGRMSFTSFDVAKSSSPINVKKDDNDDIQANDVAKLSSPINIKKDNDDVQAREALSIWTGKHGYSAPEMLQEMSPSSYSFISEIDIPMKSSLVLDENGSDESLHKSEMEKDVEINNNITHELPNDISSLKQERDSLKIHLDKIKAELAEKESKFQIKMIEMEKIIKGKSVSLENSEAEITMKENEIIRLQKALKKESSELKHMTIEVNRLKASKRNVNIKSLKERLAAACDLHMIVSQQVEERSKELEKERNYRLLLMQQRGDSLQMHIFGEVEVIKENIGRGSFGKVTVVRVAGTPCVLKSLHDILLGYGNQEYVSEDQQASIRAKFYEECNIQWKLHHPNIVQFMGIYYHEGKEPNNLQKMSLIMEYLPISLDECLTRCNDKKVKIPLSLKLSMLRDIAYGLTRLHLMSIIHRDLSAGNILIASNMRAKIADFGVSKWINPNASLVHSKAPGAQYIMPPEAFDENPQYTTKLDIFSYGIVSIYMFLQEIPIPFYSAIQPCHAERNQREIGARMNYLRKLNELLAEMKELASDCIEDLPEVRPTAEELARSITHLIKDKKLDVPKDTIEFLSSTEVGKKLLISPEDL